MTSLPLVGDEVIVYRGALMAKSKRRGHGEGSVFQVRHFGADQIAPQEQEVENKMTS
jgi:hypothetical protein